MACFVAVVGMATTSIVFADAQYVRIHGGKTPNQERPGEPATADLVAKVGRCLADSDERPKWTP